MPELTNCKVSTEHRYVKDDNENLPYSGQRYHYLKIEVKIPGGVATYEIPSTEDINSSIEKAISLLPKS